MQVKLSGRRRVRTPCPESWGLIEPPPGVVYDRLGYGIVFMDARGRDFTFDDTGRHLEAWCGQGSRLTPAMARDLAAALERFADYADGATVYVLTDRT